MSTPDPPAVEATPTESPSSSSSPLSPDPSSWRYNASNSSLVSTPTEPDSSRDDPSDGSNSTSTSPSTSPILSPPPENPFPSPPPPSTARPPESSPESSPPPPLPLSPPPSSPSPFFSPPTALPSPPPPVAVQYSPPPSPPQQSSPMSPSQPLSPPPSPPPPSDSSILVPLVPVVPSPPPPSSLFVPPPAIEQNPPTSDSLPPAGNSTSSTTLIPTKPSTSSPSNINNSASVVLVPPSSHSNTKSPTSSSTSTNSNSPAVGNNPSSSAAAAAQKTAVVGGVVAGVVILALIATIFVLSWKKKKKRRPDAYPTQYVPPPNFSIQSDGYYYGQNSSLMAVPGQSGPFFPSQVPHPGNGNSFISQVGSVYQGGGLDSELLTGTKSFYSYEEVMEMTSGFAHQNIIGEGGFGSVYKGQLHDGRLVAVKQLKAGSGQGDREFRAEVEIISRVHHRHLVSLVGYCIQDSQRLLIYEFLPNKTLDYHLHGKDQPVLEWEKRLKIAIGSAKGLAYLHEDCHPKIIHRDIKSSNILLDDAFEAQVSDFGLAKLTNDTSTHVSTRVMGTFGYLAPEYASSGKLTDRSDVFSFGVVLLELITGRKPVDPTQPLGDESLVEWSRPLLIQALETGDLSEVIDPRLQKHYVEREMLRMIEAAAACIRHSAMKRPRMAQVVRALDSDGGMSDLTNGVKYGQSTVYDSGQYSEDIMKFRRMALDSSDTLDFDSSSRDHTSKEVPSSTSWRSRDSSGDFTGSESECRAFNPANSHKK